MLLGKWTLKKSRIFVRCKRLFICIFLNVFKHTFNNTLVTGSVKNINTKQSKGIWLDLKINHINGRLQLLTQNNKTYHKCLCVVRTTGFL